MSQTLYDYCLATGKDALLRQWDEQKNEALTPADVSPGTHRKVWWICDNGHHWQAQVRSRVDGCGCPVCAGKQVLPGENDLATLYPHLAAQWHPEKNGLLRPQDVPPGTVRKVWWQCEQGHEWSAAVASRTCGTASCPVCAGKQVLAGYNDLATLFPRLAKEWDSEKNGALSPKDVTIGSNRSVWWHCGNGHSYAGTIASRVRDNKGCPYCAGRKVLAGFNDLTTVFPTIAAQWHPELNGALSPNMVTSGSRRKAWWQCEEGHIWCAAVYSRTGPHKCGCPVCAGRRDPLRDARYARILAEATHDQSPRK